MGFRLVKGIVHGLTSDQLICLDMVSIYVLFNFIYSFILYLCIYLYLDIFLFFFSDGGGGGGMLNCIS